MNTKQIESIFSLAGIDILKIEYLIDGYGYPPDDPRFKEKPPRCCWYFVKTIKGWIKIGERKRVIAIDWSDTDIQVLVTDDDVTKGLSLVHAWTITDTIKYLTALGKKINEANNC